MALQLYRDCIEIREDFIPVYSEQADNIDRNAWKSFIPHQSMQNVLDTLIDALQRGKKSDCRSLWIHGAYGTGKTFAAFTIKHLLEDDLDQVEDYFAQYSEIKHLWMRFSGLRKQNRPMVIYVSSSSHINSNFKLIVNIHEAVRRELKKRGIIIPVQTFRAKMIELLDGKDSTFNWQKAFEKHRHKFTLQYSSPDEVIDKLRSDTSSKEQSKLLQDVNDVLEEESLAVMDDAFSLREWLREVQEAIKEQYDSIIFIWDEFTDFFLNNVPLSGFQEMAHTTSEMPFYFLIITHRSLEIALSNAQLDERKKISDRFHMLPFQMAPVTAYHLISSALSIKDKCVDEWKDYYKVNLMDKIKHVAGVITSSDSNVELSQFEKLIPIHPYTAYMLATISRLFSSSQRTLFQFLKESSQGTFPWFIEYYPGDSNYWWLSVDWLWDYFFSSENKYTDLIDRVRDVVAYSTNRLTDLEDESHRRVFKTIMLLISLSREMGSEAASGSQSLISPRKSKIEQIFSGTEIQDKIENILNSLHKNDFIHAIPIGRDTEFILPIARIDEKRMQEIKKSLSSETNFRDLLKSGNELHTKLSKLFKVNDVHGER